MTFQLGVWARGFQILTVKKQLVTKCYTRPRNRMNSLERPRQQELHTSGSKYGPVAGSCKHDNEPSGSVKGGEYLDQLSDC